MIDDIFGGMSAAMEAGRRLGEQMQTDAAIDAWERHANDLESRLKWSQNAHQDMIRQYNELVDISNRNLENWKRVEYENDTRVDEYNALLKVCDAHLAEKNRLAAVIQNLTASQGVREQAHVKQLHVERTKHDLLEKRCELLYTRVKESDQNALRYWGSAAAQGADLVELLQAKATPVTKTLHFDENETLAIKKMARDLVDLSNVANKTGKKKWRHFPCLVRLLFIRRLRHVKKLYLPYWIELRKAQLSPLRPSVAGWSAWPREG